MPWILALGGVLLVGAAAVAVLTTPSPGAAPAGSAGPSAGSAAASAGSVAPSIPPAATGAAAPALPVFEATAGDPAVGAAIPEVRGAAFDGSRVAIAHDGRPKVVLFLAHWCPHCQREVPVVQAWLDAGRLDGSVDLVSVATGIDPRLPNYPPDAWLAREGWTAPVLVDTDGSVADRYGLSAFPYWVAVDARGKVVVRATGELTPGQIDALVAAAAG